MSMCAGNRPGNAVVARTRRHDHESPRLRGTPQRPAPGNRGATGQFERHVSVARDIGPESGLDGLPTLGRRQCILIGWLGLAGTLNCFLWRLICHYEGHRGCLVHLRKELGYLGR